MQVLVVCVLLITGLMVYFPVIFIRKMNRLISTVERVEANTRSAASGGAPR
jgi:hypothetical protein